MKLEVILYLLCIRKTGLSRQDAESDEAYSCLPHIQQFQDISTDISNALGQTLGQEVGQYLSEISQFEDAFFHQTKGLDFIKSFHNYLLTLPCELHTNLN